MFINLPKRNLYFLSVFSGLLLALGWPNFGFAGLLFIGFVPLLLIEHEIYLHENNYKHIKLFLIAFVGFFTWNAITTYWVCFASIFGGVTAVLMNATIMSAVFVFFHNVKKKLGEIIGYIALIAFWLTFEYIHLHWDLTWAWLNLGNGFSNYYKWVQWYEFTGTFGGTLWILLSNILITEVVKNKLYRNGSTKKWKWIIPLLLITFPILLSYSMYFGYSENKSPVNVVVVQPNIDPYNEKFSGPFQEQLTKMLDLAKKEVDSTTDYLVFPETALTESLWENEIDSTYSIYRLKEFRRKFPKLNIVTGAATNKAYLKNEPLTITARKFTEDEGYYDSYNTALQLDKNGKIQLYHKSKLVPGVEKMPFPFLLKPLEGLAVNLGGTTGSLGTQIERTPLVTNSPEIKIASVICYESIFGEYVTDYVKNGAQLIFIITNDGWWGNTAGYKQHLNYASLRAIETRRSIARSANTGISCFVNQLGDETQLTEWWKPAAIKETININNEETFYVMYGDYIARVAMLVTSIIILFSIYQRFVGKKKM